MSDRSDAEPSPSSDAVLRAILAELRTLNRHVSQIAARVAAQDEFDPARAHDPGDAVPPGVAVQEPVPMTPQDERVRRALERLPSDRDQRTGATSDEQQ